MAQLERHGDELMLTLRWRERLDAVRGEVRVPVALVREVEVVDDPLAAVHGIHSHGGGPWRTSAIGSYSTVRGVKTFAVVHEDTPHGLILWLTAAEFDEIVFGCPAPEALKEQLGFN